MKRHKALRHNWNPLLQGELRRADRSWRLGPDPSCEACGERTSAVLERRGAQILCYACRVDGPDKHRRTELDHPAGRRSRPRHVVQVPANLNQLFNDADDGPEARLGCLLQPSDRVRRLLRRRRLQA